MVKNMFHKHYSYIFKYMNNVDGTCLKFKKYLKSAGYLGDSLKLRDIGLIPLVAYRFTFRSG